jgi:hypothetical protein
MNRDGLISLIVSNEANRRAEWSTLKPFDRTLAKEIMDYLLESSGRSIEFISVHDPYVEVAAFPELDPPLILTGRGHYRRLYDVLHLIDVEVPSEDVAAQLSRQVILLSLSDCFFRLMHEELAVRCFMLAFLGAENLVMPPDFPSIFANDASLRDVISQYYGLAHEIGHCASNSFSVTTEWFNEGIAISLAEDLAHAKQSPLFDEASASRHLAQLKNQYAGMSSNEAREEISADLFAVQHLFEFCAIGWKAEYTTEGEFAREFFDSLTCVMNAISISERLQSLARLAARREEDSLTSQDWATYTFNQKATYLRLEAIARHLTFITSVAFIKPDGRLIGFGAIDWQEILKDVVTARAPRVDALDYGLTLARERLLIDLPTNELLDKMKILCAQESPQVGWMVEFFVERGLAHFGANALYISKLAAVL